MARANPSHTRVDGQEEIEWALTAEDAAILAVATAGEHARSGRGSAGLRCLSGSAAGIQRPTRRPAALTAAPDCSATPDSRHGSGSSVSQQPSGCPTLWAAPGAARASAPPCRPRR